MQYAVSYQQVVFLFHSRNRTDGRRGNAKKGNLFPFLGIVMEKRCVSEASQNFASLAEIPL
jgi:hypothetical protein